jgi:hypothetical protein
MAQLVVSVAGAAIGFFIGGPAGAQAGFALGSFVGAQLFAPKPKGPSPLDSKWQGVEYGSPVSWYSGTMRLSMVPIYMSDKIAVAQTTEAGKGGSDVVTGYEYYADVMMLVAARESDALLEIFKEGKLVWTNRSTASAQSLLNSESSENWEELRFYGGAEGQEPDPDYEAAKGIGLAPAYIGWTTIFFKRLRLNSSAQIPQMSAVCSTDAVLSYTPQALGTYASEGSYVSLGALGLVSGLPVCGFGDWATTYPAESSVSFRRFNLDGTVSLLDTRITGQTGPTLTGLSDVPIVVWRTLAGATSYRAIRYTGGAATSQVSYTLTTGVGSVQGKFCVNGSDIYFAGEAVTDVYLCGINGGSPTASGSFTNPVVALATDATYLYGAEYNGTDLYILDRNTLTLSSTETLPATTGTGSFHLLFIEGTLHALFAGGGTTGSLYRRTGVSTWTLVTSSVTQPNGSGSHRGSLAVSGGNFFVCRFTGTSDPDNPMSFQVTLNGSTADENTYVLSDLITDLHARCGEGPSLLDVSDLTAIEYRGCLANGPQPVRSLIEQGCAAYFVDRVEADGQYKYVRRGGASLVTIPYSDLGVAIDDAQKDALQIDEGDEIRVPQAIELGFLNFRQNYEVGSERATREVTPSQGNDKADLAFALRPAEAKAIAEVMVQDAQVSKRTYRFSVGMEYAYLTPTDVVTVTGRNGTTHRVRILDTSEQQGAIDIIAVADDQQILTAVGITSDEYEPQTTVSAPSDTTMVLMDIAPTRDTESELPGYLVAATGVGSWPYASILRSLDGNSYDTEVARIYERAVIGTATSVLASAPPLGRVNIYETMTVRVLGTLSSSTRSVMQQDRTINVMAVETDSGGWEVIRFRTATLTGTDGDYNLYTLTSLHRGRQGTEWAVADHSSGNRVVLLSVSGLRSVDIGASEIGLLRYFKGVTAGRAISTATAVEFTPESVRSKPWSPVRLRASVDESNNTTITWNRRTRLEYRVGGVGGNYFPLGEETESYDVRLMNGSTEVSSDTVTEEQWEIQAYSNEFSLEIPSQFIYEQGSALHGVLESSGAISYRKHTTAGVYVAGTYLCNDAVYAVANDGAFFFAACYNGPDSSTVRRVDTSTATVTHTVSHTAGDPQGLAFDGTDLWLARYYNGSIDRLDPDDLTTLNTYSLNVGIGAMAFSGGSLWICDVGSDEIVEWDIATTAEVGRFSCVEAPADILVIGSLVFVAGGVECAVYSTSGTEQNRFEILGSTRGRRLLASFDGMVAVSNSAGVVLMDETTGDTVGSISVAGTTSVAGASSTHLFVGIGRPATETRAYAESVSLSGLTVEVYQNSATVGRGYVAEIDL